MGIVSSVDPVRSIEPVGYEEPAGSVQSTGFVAMGVRGLSLSMEGRSVLGPVSVDIPGGEIFTIVGPSGSGKTMFLRTLNRLTEPDSGTITLAGTDIRSIPPRELRRRVGMVFQTPVIFPGTVLDNLLMGPSMREETGPRGREAQTFTREDADSLLRSVGLASDILHREAAKLSVGEQQRVCIARALANDPEVLLLDESTASLDPGSTTTIERLMVSLNRELGLTLVMVTHNMEQARRIGHTTMLLEAGRVTLVLPTREFFSTRGFREVTCCIGHSRVSCGHGGGDGWGSLSGSYDGGGGQTESGEGIGGQTENHDGNGAQTENHDGISKEREKGLAAGSREWNGEQGADGGVTVHRGVPGNGTGSHSEGVDP